MFASKEEELRYLTKIKEKLMKDLMVDISTNRYIINPVVWHETFRSKEAKELNLI